MLTAEQKDALIQDLYSKCMNNNDGMIWITPSLYGFDHSSDGTRACKDVLRALGICKRIEIDGTDLLRIYMER